MRLIVQSTIDQVFIYFRTSRKFSSVCDVYVRLFMLSTSEKHLKKEILKLRMPFNF